LFGAVVGAAVALLYAPKTGKETRAHLKRITEDFVEDAGEIGTELKEHGRRFVEEGKTRVSEIVEKGKDKYSKVFRRQEPKLEQEEVPAVFEEGQVETIEKE
jgi:gas vesicle protein